MIQLLRRCMTQPSIVLVSILALGLLATACTGSDSLDAAADADDRVAATEAEAATDAPEDVAEVIGAEQATTDDVVETIDADLLDDDEEEADASTDAATSGLAPDAGTVSDDDEQTELEATEDDEIELDQPESDGDRLVSDGADGIGGTDLQQILPFFGITDPAEAAVCIEEEAKSEGLTLDDLSSGAGNGIMIAAVRCRPEPMRELFATEFGQIDSSSLAATPAQLECGFDTLLSWFPTVPLAGADDVFDGTAPDEVIDLIAENCAMSRDDADAFLNDA